MPKRPYVLVVLDGWGMREETCGNAIAAARTPNFTRYWRDCPHTLVRTDGLAVGLPEGQFGNSEVGHQNLGAGRVVLQTSTRITQAIHDGSFFRNPALLRAILHAQEQKSRLHLMGLVSDGGVHSFFEHLLALIELAQREHVYHLYIHAFLDGRDTPPTSGAEYLQKLEECCEQRGLGTIATLIGRYWAMDRDNRWERTERAYRALRWGEGQRDPGPPVEALRRAYARGQTDEFVEPIILDPDGTIRDNDAVIFFNFRADRARQLTRAFTEESFSLVERGPRPAVEFVTLTPYDERSTLPAAFPSEEPLQNIFGEVLSDVGLTQLRIAETEKYAHVTYFFNNGRETPFPREDRILIPSPKVATYDLKPEMSAYEVTQKAIQQILTCRYDFILINYANPDMVGHTGIFEAAVRAVEAVDDCLGQIVEATRSVNGELLITADHGNADRMRDEAGRPHTAHTHSPGPLIYVGPRAITLRAGGKLGDIAPTMLALMGLAQPKEMTGQNLIE
ncbi:MAG: 2,3-bisphosphoglycerate-independent phosphoglycerate mutase [Candidatus Bipolaricaulota bacterium]|nr:2,3-bisphosphoglycerate-independent phosphoglycerate mutase [Candidatus Bipolaricaulota bacterium]MCS7274761.1 2,3-bisphosphoglycerate-independent phosphoglycerate mutase [Candidatus Bipolaricaulota bacterium]MDW8110041.1 2,3-bisphosphoglycerate-independent phosphoglycerate mutase [Candidatus Bipolaricaulota bacterium]MDW8329466.1 2,3-bisphosphoglycerate-independent phosphoglycerate mutase [Candidatus Bipolaricaulota bacterium]